MTTQEAREIFQKIRSEYAALPYPKYVNANLEELEETRSDLGFVSSLSDLALCGRSRSNCKCERDERSCNGVAVRNVAGCKE